MHLSWNTQKYDPDALYRHADHYVLLVALSKAKNEEDYYVLRDRFVQRVGGEGASSMIRRELGLSSHPLVDCAGVRPVARPSHPSNCWIDSPPPSALPPSPPGAINYLEEMDADASWIDYKSHVKRYGRRANATYV